MRIAKAIAAVVGIIMIVGSIGLIAAGTFVVTATDDADGFISAGPLRVRTDAAALVGDDIELFFDEPVRGGVFLGIDDIETRLRVIDSDGDRLFVGIGPSAEVDDYLAGGSYSIVEVFGDRVVLDDRAGDARLAAPADQDFWAASTLDEVLNWDLQSGRWSIVVMNEDGTAGIDSSVTVGARVPFLEPVGVAVLVVGLIGIVIGIALTYFGVRSEPPRQTPASSQSPLEPAPVV